MLERYGLSVHGPALPRLNRLEFGRAADALDGRRTALLSDRLALHQEDLSDFERAGVLGGAVIDRNGVDDLILALGDHPFSRFPRAASAAFL